MSEQLQAITDFVKRVNDRAEKSIIKGMVSGAHYNAMLQELAAMRDGHGEIGNTSYTYWVKWHVAGWRAEGETEITVNAPISSWDNLQWIKAKIVADRNDIIKNDVVSVDNWILLSRSETNEA